MKEKSKYLEAGKIVNTHGVRGEIKIEPWFDTPEAFCRLKRIFIDGKEVKILRSRPQGHMVIAALEGVADIDGAIRLKNKVLLFDRADVKLPEGENFISDLIGLDAVDDETGEKIGIISDVLTLPAGNIYEIKGEREILIPAVSQFVVSADVASGAVRFRLIEGM